MSDSFLGTYSRETRFCRRVSHFDWKALDEEKDPRMDVTEDGEVVKAGGADKQGTDIVPLGLKYSALLRWILLS